MTRQFTPFRDIWQTLADDLGITTKRMRESRLDMAGDQELALRNSNMALAEVIRTGSPEEQAIAAQRMRDVAAATSRNMGAIRRTGQPELNIASAGELTAPFYQQREQGRLAGEADTQNKMFELAKQRRDEFHDRITQAQAQLSSVRTNADTFLSMLNELGANDAAVQARYRDLVGMSTSDAKGSAGALTVGVPGLGRLNVGGEPETKFDYNQMVKGVAAWLAPQAATLNGQLKMLETAAVKSGFELDPSGGLLDVGAARYGTAGTQPRAPNQSDVLTQPPSPRQGIEAAVNSTLGLSPGRLGELGANAIEAIATKVPQLPRQAMDAVSRFLTPSASAAPVDSEPIPTDREGTINGVYIPPALRRFFNRKRRPVNR